MAEDLLSEGILPARGILAGCPFATMMARVYLIMQEAAQLRSITALDTWVDDIGADFEYPEQAAFAVYEGYKTLRRLLEGSDLRLSLKKTGFPCTTAEARRELQKLRKDGDPAICDSMKDLGLDCALGRVRRVKVQRARRHKAGQRQKKLKQLRVPGVPAKVRLFSVQPLITVSRLPTQVKQVCNCSCKRALNHLPPAAGFFQLLDCKAPGSFQQVFLAGPPLLELEPGFNLLDHHCAARILVPVAYRGQSHL